MQLSDVEKRFLALHYYLPVPLNRFQRLFRTDPMLHNFPTYSNKKLAFLLNLSIEKASLLKKYVEGKMDAFYEGTYHAHQIFPLTFMNQYYPKTLLSMIDPPAIIYAKGNIELLKKDNKIAIIGARQATSYSEKALQFLLPPLVKNDIIIVSGLAKGADTMAHKAAIKYGGQTIAVLGNGFFHTYPKENRTLQTEIGRAHLLLTEYPPYVAPHRWTFPMRNRIISGLSNAVIVTEAKVKSGTMSTVDHALEHGKDVYCIPGPITSELSEGPNKLIAEGAIPVWNGFDLLTSFNYKK